MPLPYDDVHLIADPLYGYLRITLRRASRRDRRSRRHRRPWVQRLKRIHQLQSSWWVFPTAEHSRFAHSLGTMHLAGELARQVYPTLAEVEPGTPSLPLVEETLRLAGLLHDLGHGPFSHFCDEEYLLPACSASTTSRSRSTSSSTSWVAASRSCGGARAGPFAAGEAVDPWHVAFLVRAEEPARRTPRPTAAALGRPHPALGPPAAPRALRRRHGRQHGLRAPRRLACAASALGPVDVDRLDLLHLLHRRRPHVPQARAELAARLPQRALLHVRERLLPPHRARHRPAPARDLPAHDGAICCRTARSTTAARTSGSPSGRCSRTVEALARRAAGEREARAGRGVAAHHPPRT